MAPLATLHPAARPASRTLAPLDISSSFATRPPPSHIHPMPLAPSSSSRQKSRSSQLRLHPQILPLAPPSPTPSLAQSMLASHSLPPAFAARFNITSELGSGGFGFVLAAFDLLLIRQVAVKFIIKSRVPPNRWVRDTNLGVIPLEVYLLHHCNHSNIIAFIAVFHDSKFVYLVTELHGSHWDAASGAAAPDVSHASNDTSHDDATITSSITHLDKDYMVHPLQQSTDNKPSITPPPSTLSRATSFPLPVKLTRRPSMDLFECIEHFQRIPEHLARIIFRQIASAIRYLHAKGIVHRDIKDENIVIDHAFHVKLIDFGSAAVEMTDSPLFDRFQGTVQYASPEILSGDKYRGKPADIWALGVLLYTILFGEVPFASSEQAKYCRYKHPRFVVSDACLGLLDLLLEKRVWGRPCAEMVLRHPWVGGGAGMADASLRRTVTTQ